MRQPVTFGRLSVYCAISDRPILEPVRPQLVPELPFCGDTNIPTTRVGYYGGLFSANRCKKPLDRELHGRQPCGDINIPTDRLSVNQLLGRIMMHAIRLQWAEMVSRYPERTRCIVPTKDEDYPFPDMPNDFACPFIEICGNEYHYVVRERGTELARHKTPDRNELMFWITRDYTLWLASRYESRHRRKNEDSRRQWMSLHVSLLRRMSENWAERERVRYDDILSRHPFSDGRANCIDESEYRIE